MRVLFSQGFVSLQRDYKASDAVGYGITSAEAVMEALTGQGVEVLAVNPPPSSSPDQETRRLDELNGRFPGRLVFGETYSLPEYFRILWTADLQISTALHEGLGIATLEAMYAYNCCLLPNRCSYPEITHGLDDVLYSSTEDLVAKIDYYLKNETARQKAAAALHERSLRYTPEQVASDLVAVFSELANE